MASTAGPEARHLGYAEARERVLRAVTPLEAERTPLERAVGRALREDVRATHPLPRFTNSSMDGYAVRSRDVAHAGTGPGEAIELPVRLVLPAGAAGARPLAEGESMRIMTGAPIPSGADSVMAFEDVERIEGAQERVRIRRPARPGENIRSSGRDLEAGALALESGRELSPHDLALLASLGVASPRVGRQPRVAILSTGDELLDLEAPLVPGAIRDSNVPLLRGLVEATSGAVVRATRVKDDPDAVVAEIRKMLGEADVVLTIGGVSAGDFDPVKQALAALGEVELWRVAMKPGRPQAFGTPGSRLFYGLPGNPASVACVFEALVRPALRKLQGFLALDRPRVPVRSAESIESRAGRTDFVRVTLAWRGEVLWASPAGAQVSGHLAPQSRAHALLVIPEEAETLGAGERAEALVLRMPSSPA